MRPAKPELIRRAYQPGDEQAILAAFNRVFGALDPEGFEPRTLETWRWQFLDNPCGHRIWLSVDPEGNVAAQQASLPVRVQVGDERMCWSQVVDSFADPHYGRGLKKPGLYAITAREHEHVYGGDPPERDAVMYGLPVRSAWRIGKLYLDYEVIRSQDALFASLAKLRAGLPAAPGVEVQELERFPEEVEVLFERARAPHRALAVRDAAYLNWRFTDHPLQTYRMAFARRAGQPVGLAIYRGGTVCGEPFGLICDWLVVPDDPAANHALLAWLAERAREEGLEGLAGVWPETCPEWLTLQRLGFRVQSTGYYNVFCQYTERFDLRWLYWNWYYALGDFDLC